MKHIEKDMKSPLVREAIIRLAVSEKYDSDPRVREIIRTLYHGCCAYCECKPEAGSSFEIEHFYIKKKGVYPEEYAKDIRNLHYSCKACNTKKSTNKADLFLSPNYRVDANGKWYDTPSSDIENSISYKDYLLVALNTDSGRGASTIAKLQLNDRPYLVESRIRSYSQVYKLLQATSEILGTYIRTQEDAPAKKKALIILFGLIKSYMSDDAEFSTMIIQNFGVQIEQLLKVWKKIK